MSETARAESSVRLVAAPPETVAIASLVTARMSPRQGPLDERHVRALQEVIDVVPPIIVHRPTMAVIDGAHRLEAMRQMGRTEVRVIFFEGSEPDAFVLAVQANATHGRPLSFEERKRSARVLLVRFPDRSTRWIASVCALSSATVARLRPCLDGPEKRVGLDGRVRPVDPTGIRSTIAERLEADPDASVRQVATDIGVSPSTVRRMMDHRSHLGHDDHAGDGSTQGSRATAELAARPVAEPLKVWLEATAVPEQQGFDFVAALPSEQLAPAADEFRRRSDYWAALADRAAERARA